MNKENKVLSGNTDMLVLKLLAMQDMYGYMIRKTLAEQSDNLFELKEGTLYPLLHSLEKRMFVESYDKTSPEGKPRKYYHITRDGLDYLISKQKEWERSTAAINNIMQSFRMDLSNIWDSLS